MSPLFELQREYGCSSVEGLTRLARSWGWPAGGWVVDSGGAAGNRQWYCIAGSVKEGGLAVGLERNEECSLPFF